MKKCFGYIRKKNGEVYVVPDEYNNVKVGDRVLCDVYDAHMLFRGVVTSTKVGKWGYEVRGRALSRFYYWANPYKNRRREEENPLIFGKGSLELTNYYGEFEGENVFNLSVSWADHNTFFFTFKAPKTYVQDPVKLLNWVKKTYPKRWRQAQLSLRTHKNYLK